MSAEVADDEVAPEALLAAEAVAFNFNVNFGLDLKTSQHVIVNESGLRQVASRLRDSFPTWWIYGK